MEGIVWRADGGKQAIRTLRNGVQRGRRKLGVKAENHQSLRERSLKGRVKYI